MICPDCKGAGQNVGFSSVEPCAACGGSGRSQYGITPLAASEDLITAARRISDEIRRLTPRTCFGKLLAPLHPGQWSTLSVWDGPPGCVTETGEILAVNHDSFWRDYVFPAGSWLLIRECSNKAAWLITACS